MHRQSPIQSRRSGFTLIELLAATGIMVVLVLLVLNLTTQVLDTWSYSTGKLTQNFESRMAIDMLSEDLQTAVFRNNQEPWLEVRQNTAGGSPPSGADTFTEPHFYAQPVNRIASSRTRDLQGD
ncbi:MAG: prepilin-type N-terminal cleavage/methylation domain-containing protein, partial [Verrucomicrobiota bacterium]